jgi:hypothetical protein
MERNCIGTGHMEYILLGIMIVLTPSMLVLAVALWRPPSVSGRSAQQYEPIEHTRSLPTGL